MMLHLHNLELQWIVQQSSIMLDSIVQLIRNFLCCIKDWHLFSDTWLYDPKVTQQYYDFPEPLNKTTPLEAMISVVQAYVVYSGVPSSWNLFWLSYGKLKRINRLMERQAAESAANKKSDVDRLVNMSLVKEAIMALRSMFVGFNVFFIACSFIWLAGNSWHVTETDWIGGLPGLIHALTVMNLCLTPLLYYMYKDGKEQMKKAAKLRSLTKKLEKGEAQMSDVQLSALESLTGWKPFWDAGFGLYHVLDEAKETKLLEQEKVKIKKRLESIVGPAEDKTKQVSVQKQQSIEAKNVRKGILFEGYREYVYLILNTIAWYGYGVCILVYYFPEELKQPDWMRLLLLNFSNDDVEWRGNFAGDLMWTIEPTVALLSPLYLNALSRSRQKLKAKQD